MIMKSAARKRVKDAASLAAFLMTMIAVIFAFHALSVL